MRIPSKLLLMTLFLSVLALPLIAQQRDPLTDAESDQLREQAMEPLKRFKLLVRFATERLNKVDLARQAPRTEDRAKRIHDALTDFRQIIDELDDNIDDYSDKHMDMRKPLQEVVEAETSFQKRLEDITRGSEDPKNADEYPLYNFALRDATESVSLSLEDAKKTLDEQNQAFQEKKKK